jgi:hypothetical protein
MGDDFEEIEDDFEEIGEKSSSGPVSSLFEVIGDVVKQIPFKIAIFLFLIYIFISSDMFVDWGLSYIPGCTEHRRPSAKGVVVQGVIITIAFIIISMLVNSELV